MAYQPYATLAELAEQVNSDRSSDLTGLERALSTATDEVTSICGRRFWRDDAVSAKTFPVNHHVWAWVADISTDVGVIVETDTSDDGSFGTTWAATDWELGPANGEVGGLTGFPYSKITAVGSYVFPTWTRRERCLRVTARWGWVAIPDPVRSATLIAAEELWRMKDAPFGVAGINALDGALMRVRHNPFIASLLAPYCIGLPSLA